MPVKPGSGTSSSSPFIPYLKSLILGVEIDYRRRISLHELTSRLRVRRSSPNLVGNTMVICSEIKQVRVHITAFCWLWKELVPGNESYAIVEFAPYQKVPTEKRKPDARNATIEKGT